MQAGILFEGKLSEAPLYPRVMCRENSPTLFIAWFWEKLDFRHPSVTQDDIVVAGMVADTVAHMVSDMVANMVADMVAVKKVDKVADMEVADMVADMVAAMEVNKVADIFKTKYIKPEMF